MEDAPREDKNMESSLFGLEKKVGTSDGHTLISPMMSSLRVTSSDFTIRSEDFTVSPESDHCDRLQQQTEGRGSPIVGARHESFALVS